MIFKSKSIYSRRTFVKGGVLGLGGLLLRSLATGLPPATILGPLTSFGQEVMSNSQTLILSTSSAGDPMNVNCPGSYVDGVVNNPNLNAVDFVLGSTQTRACEMWANLPAAMRNQLAFVHYRTNSAAHTEYASTMAFHGAVKNAAGNGTEMLPSVIADLAAGPLGTLQRNPIPLGQELISVDGQPLQNLKPSEIKALFAEEASTIENLSALRDQALDDLYAELKMSGTRSQRSFLDQYALSQAQARSLGDSLGSLLDALPANPDPDIVDGPLDQVIAAVALARLRVAPVITLNIPFGRDNHQDSDLTQEAEQTNFAGTVLSRLWQELESAQLTETVTFGLLNVFGRTHGRNAAGGRNHNRLHAVMVAFGSNIKAGVYGGIGANGACLDLDATSGQGRDGGTIPADETMSACGKTLMACLGIPDVDIQKRIQGGSVITGMRRS